MLSPCQNKGTCECSVCNCTPNYSGTRCEEGIHAYNSSLQFNSLQVYIFIYYPLFSSDVNECELNMCQSVCGNAFGSFACGCYSGYELDEDGLSCSGRPIYIV